MSISSFTTRNSPYRYLAEAVKLLIFDSSAIHVCGASTPYTLINMRQ